MEYLVTMTTKVPDGTDAATVADVRAREAAHSKELAADGHLLRLWRPPLQPGEWRTLGLFAAADEVELEKVLSSMPLRVWRSDELMALGAHRNDPGRAETPAGPQRGGQEFFTVFHLAVPDGTPDALVGETKDRERQRAAELAASGQLLRLWTLRRDGTEALGLWRVADAAELQGLLDALPLQVWMTEDVTPLAAHPSDPGTISA